MIVPERRDSFDEALGSWTLVEQPPLDGSRICALVRTGDPAENFLFHSLRLDEAEAYGRDSYSTGT